MKRISRVALLATLALVLAVSAWGTITWLAARNADQAQQAQQQAAQSDRRADKTAAAAKSVVDQLIDACRQDGAAASVGPACAGWLAKTKFVRDGRTTKPSFVSSRAIASRPATILAQVSRK